MKYASIEWTLIIHTCTQMIHEINTKLNFCVERTNQTTWEIKPKLIQLYACIHRPKHLSRYLHFIINYGCQQYLAINFITHLIVLICFVLHIAAIHPTLSDAFPAHECGNYWFIVGVYYALPVPFALNLVVRFHFWIASCHNSYIYPQAITQSTWYMTSHP